jgi:ABC-2 type transport system permease protein
VLRGFAFLIAAIAYGGVWLGLAMLFSVQFRSSATAALASLAVWLLFAFFWNMVVTVITPIIAPVDPYNPMSVLYTVEVGQALSRLSPNTLFAETTMAFLNPATRSLGLVLQSQMQGAISGPLPFSESVALVWPQVTGLLASVIGLFTVAYVMFQRQEVRA